MNYDLPIFQPTPPRLSGISCSLVEPLTAQATA